MERFWVVWLVWAAIVVGELQGLSGCLEKERLGLMELLKSLHPYKLTALPRDSDCCSWHGVKCSASTGRVRSLSFHSSTNNFLNISLFLPFEELLELHLDGCGIEPHIVHRDIKSSNILLDENFTAHLADFGLARLILPHDTHVTTDPVGTLGYIPPEYGQASVATYKGDIYSFGVVLLELLTGKRPMDICKPKECRDLISWVFQMKKEGKESEVYDPFIYEKHHGKQMLRVLEVACLCLSEYPKSRPSTQQLVSWLDNII